MPGKVFNDPIHGHIKLHPACVKILDTRQFQRLRHIKQLDACYFVYPGASHNRFEHSIGVCHLAGKLLRAIRDRQSDKDLMSEKDILCVEIAGLCHDLGQGPFSHLFEKQFIPQMMKDDPRYKNWKHESAAVMMFEAMLKDHNDEIKKHLKEKERLDDIDLKFIAELIDVPKDLDAEDWPYEGRQRDKSFLYEVVANKKHGIDVDKWDYLARDSYMCGIKVNFDHNRCIANAKILTADGRKQICYRDKAVDDLYDMFYTRMSLHRRVYKHKTQSGIEIMLYNALVAANEHLEFNGKKGIANAIKDAESYTQLTDEVLQTILQSPNRELKTSQDILNKITTRNIYVFVAETIFKLNGSREFDKTKFKEDLGKMIKLAGRHHLDVDSVQVDVVTVDYGMKEKNPMKNVRFFGKENGEAFAIEENQVSFFLPSTFGELYIRVYCNDKNDKELLHDIKKEFKRWCTRNECPTPRGL